MRNHLGRCAETRRRARARMRRGLFLTLLSRTRSPPLDPPRSSPDPAAPPFPPSPPSRFPSQLRVQAVPHRARQRGELPRAHAGSAAPAESGQARGARRRRARAESGCAGDGASLRASNRAAEIRADRAPRVPRHEAVRPRERPPLAPVPGGLPRDRGGREAAAPVHERVRAEARTLGQAVPVPLDRRRAVRGHRVQGPERGRG